MKGILFKPDSIKAIVEVRKTQTRRLIGLANTLDTWYDHKWVTFDKRDNWWLFKGRSRETDALETFVLKPRYQVGEVVYIKEAYKVVGTSTLRQGHKVIQKGAGVTYKDGELRNVVCPLDVMPNLIKWYSPFFMPEWAARYFIKIKSIRAERLKEITWEDCKAEGIGQYTFARGCCSENPPDARWKFIELWDSINPKYPWDSNPFVFVYEFEKVDKC